MNPTGGKKRTGRRTRKRKPKARTAADEEGDSDSESDSNELSGVNKIGPTTEHELKEVPASIIELPFDAVSESDLKTIKSFGVVSSLIDNVVVIKGDPNMGYETVLDEGSVICWQDGTVIGKVSKNLEIRVRKRLLTRSFKFSPDLRNFWCGDRPAL